MIHQEESTESRPSNSIKALIEEVFLLKSKAGKLREDSSEMRVIMLEMNMMLSIIITPARERLSQ
jgi:hypothetical protein